MQKESKEGNRNGLGMRKKMARLEIVYKGPDLDHTTHQNTHTNNHNKHKSSKPKPLQNYYTQKFHEEYNNEKIAPEIDQ